jgi:hypothetical protein
MSTNYIEKVLLTQKSGLIGYWPLNEESGTTALDLSGNGYNATTKNVVRGWNDRRMLALDGSKCTQFDGSTTAIDISGMSASEPTTEGSLSIWIATPQTQLAGTTKMQIIKMAADANNFIDLTFDTTAYRFNAAYEGGGTDKNINSPLVYNENAAMISPQWHHFVMTWSATGDALNFYVDGVAQTAATSLGTWSGSMDTDLMVLGSSAYATPADQFTGWMAHFALWTPILSQTEVDTLYDIGP